MILINNKNNLIIPGYNNELSTNTSFKVKIDNDNIVSILKGINGYFKFVDSTLEILNEGKEIRIIINKS